MSDTNVIRIKPYFYVHVLDNNTNCTRVEVGPQTYTRKDHERIVSGPDNMVMIPPRSYCIVKNPVARDEAGEVIVDNGGYKIKFGDEEIRFEQRPFPLYPGEVLFGRVTLMQVVGNDTALRLRCIRDFDDRSAGDEWLFPGPATYKPRIEVQVAEVIRATIIKPNTALKLRARKACTDGNGNERRAGEEWLMRDLGAYLPGVDEEIIQTIRAKVLTEKRALHLRASRSFTDVFGISRKAGQEWLVTLEQAETHIPDVHEQLIGEVSITTLSNRQYCVVCDPVVDESNELGVRELRRGPCSFFLSPGERLEAGIQPFYVLGPEEALLLTALEKYGEGEDSRLPGDTWMVYGPCEYVPDIEVQVTEKRTYIPLDENEGIYVRDIKTGHVRSVIGQSYMLEANEVLWEKELPADVERLLAQSTAGSSNRSHTNNRRMQADASRDKTRVVTFRTPHNSAVQIYDYKAKNARIVYGPDLVALGPDEEFTVVRLSGETPKRANVITSLSLLLGPDFMTDIVIVETADHARLSLKLAYNWYFEVDPENGDAMFRVPDFVGDACKAIASRVRGAVASVSFDSFHKNSSEIIKTAVFGIDPETEEPRTRFFFSSNNLVITNIDVQSVEPVDQRTRDALQKSVQLAIEITTSSQEATARHNAERIEQEARGRLRRQEIKDKAAAENAHIELLILQSQSAAVQATGQATAEAKALAEASAIEGRAAVKHAELHAESLRIKAKADLEDLVARNAAEIDHTKQLNELFLNKETELARIEQEKFSRVVTALGRETIKKIAQAGPEMQAKLLGGLGLESVMITDGSSPINLFSTAQGLVAQGN